MKILFLLLSLTFYCFVCSAQQRFSKQQQQTIEDFIKKASGIYNNKAQADTSRSPLLRLSEIRAFRIWTHKKNEYWISIGWYQPNVPDQPMGEKIFHIKSFEQDRFIVDCYSWKNPMDEELLLQWRKKHPYKKQNKDDLVNDGCGNYLIKNSAGEYELKTVEGEICAFNNPMAPFDGLFFHFIFGEEGKKMDIYDINYKNGQVLFDYIRVPMKMRKLRKITK